MDQEDIVYCPNGKVPTRDYIKDRIKKSHAINKKKVDKYLEKNGDMSKFWKPVRQSHVI